MLLTQQQIDSFDAGWAATKAAAVQANTSAATAVASADQATKDAAQAASDVAAETTALQAMVKLADSFVAAPAGS